MVNGYVTLDLASNKIYKESLGAIKSGKPVMIVDAPNVYFADTIAISGDDVVITKGGKTITITDANSVSSEGDIQVHLYEYLLQCTFSNESENTQYIFFRLLSNLNLENSIDNLKTLIGNKKIPVSSTVNSMSDITNGNDTLLANIYVYNDEIQIENVYDTNVITYTDFNIDKWSKTQLI